MKEITTVYTVEITCVHKNIPDSQVLRPKEVVAAELTKAIDRTLENDDILITNVQFFVRDEEDANED